jgi:hypothetical protein
LALPPPLNSSKFGLDTTGKVAVKENAMVYSAKLNPPQQAAEKLIAGAKSTPGALKRKPSSPTYWHD